MIRRTITRLISSIGLVGLTLGTLYGCSNQKLEAFLKTDLNTIMSSRVQANKAIVDTLNASGLISTSEKETILASIDKQMSSYLTDISTNTELQKKLLAAAVDWAGPSWSSYGPTKAVNYVDGSGKNKTKQVNSLGYTEDEWNESVLTTYMVNNGYTSSFNMPLFNGKGSNIEPISIVDGKTGETINSRFGYKVYVIKPFENIDGGKSLDEVIEMVKKATKDPEKIDNTILNKLFQPAKDSKNNDVTLLDISKRNNQVIANSTGSTLVDDAKFALEGGLVKETYAGNKVIGTVNSSKSSLNTKQTEAKPGNDMIIRAANGQVPIMSIRFHEFNKDAVDNIVKTLGMNPDQYLFTTYDSDGNSENRVYIMEYPVNYVDTIKNNDKDLSQYIMEFKKSNMGINVRTGKLVKYGTAWGKEKEEGVYMDDSDPYLSVAGAANNTAEGQSAFVVDGTSADGQEMVIGESKTKVKTGRIILRDYLEATYAPGIVDNEPIVIFGRKLRILQFSGSKNNIVAKYYDKEGKVIENSASLMIDDFADFAALNNTTKPTVKYIGRVGEGGGGDTGNNGSGSPTITTDANDLKASIVKIDELDKKVEKSIKPSTQFPGKEVGKSDYDNSKKPIFYAMAIKKNMFDTSLFSGWINNKDNQKNSLVWWASWLSNENRSYKYTINTTLLEEYLMGNYVFELQEDGIVILDLETIAKIQVEFEAIEKESNSLLARTSFIVFGYALVMYSFILILAWAVDTNIDLGFNILGKLSFGNWVAIKDPEEYMGYDNEDSKKYLSFRSMLLKALGVAVIGVILILINVIDVVIYLIAIFGGIAKAISNIITGI